MWRVLTQLLSEQHELTIQIGDLDFTLQSKPQIVDDFLLTSLGSQSRPQYSHPSRDEGDFLVQAFIEKVDPFVHLFHKPSFLLELNHFRRGLLGSDTTFEIMLFTIYMLALLPLKPATVETRLHEPKIALMSRYRSYVEYGLSRKNITTSQSLSSLQVFLLYMVSIIPLLPSRTRLTQPDAFILDRRDAPR